jgi:hypothetical protein
MPLKGGAIRPSVVAAAPEGPHHREKRTEGGADSSSKGGALFMDNMAKIVREKLKIDYAHIAQIKFQNSGDNIQ